MLAMALLGGANFAYGAAGDVAISEVLFDPAGGTDTGQEYVIIKNLGGSSINMSGWHLYPDGIDYFTFPDFVLNVGASVKIHLRASGADNEVNLYFPVASGNMGNSSGSLALFSSTTHSKDTIVSYVRYHNSGSSEKKTWETTAASAGIWTAGAFVDISAGAEGKILKLNDFNQRASVAGWAISDLASESTPQAEESGSADVSVSETQISGSVAPKPVAQIKAYAGEDRSAIAGATVFFDGFAEGLKGEPLDGARFSWNFGDGSPILDGKKIGHAFLYPGAYAVSLGVSSGEYSAMDTINIAVTASPLLIAEIKTGPDGWVEIKNNSARKIEISKFGLSYGGKIFIFSENTFMAPYAALVLGTTTLGFLLPAYGGEIKFIYPNGSLMSSLNYPASVLAKEESLNFNNDVWVVAEATPGAKNEKPSLKIPSAPTGNSSAAEAAPKIQEYRAASPEVALTLGDDHSSFSVNEYFWLFGGLGLGIFGGLMFFLLRIYTTKN
ncbi:MAG: nuclease [Candidatus Giovannonibacteria bacterium GW2011_GWC2_44_9]|uniref:Nuclease n=3 Tax=Candidatus Giovannoniibacteriota TaxID=1752738 RepID=A0A0G1LX97_9BACT|nr:MAG: nuclease [Candidatus Giovannonibacteria bacterium GW2011_GWB1_44_23]KKT64359.1 MAG: nuclease [Candidatus Giovannonibacteria bacterium GW2011_GWA1_44_29]KKT84314.1 MAG: nuclease [Candidatus Giovannonibacteria bacterium GW2011_GWC2_44_9]KKT92086.1 MAG: Phospholipase D/competence protein ComEA helix-hairpin-helix domain protein [Parcubacteria group bacterium GW2011_GWC1_45_13]